MAFNTEARENTLATIPWFLRYTDSHPFVAKNRLKDLGEANLTFLYKLADLIKKC